MRTHGLRFAAEAFRHDRCNLIACLATWRRNVSYLPHSAALSAESSLVLSLGHPTPHCRDTRYHRAPFLLHCSSVSEKDKPPVTAGRKARGLSETARLPEFKAPPDLRERRSLRSHRVLGRTVCGRRSPLGEIQGVSRF